MPDEVVLELIRLVHAKRTRAAKLDVLVNEGGVHEFILSGDEGAIRVFDVEGNVRFFWDTVGAETRIVDVIGGVPSVDSEDLRTLLDHMKRMEVAPPVQVPYGIVQAGTIVGINFTTEVGFDRTHRGGLGLNQDTFVVRGKEISGWLAKPTSSVSKWLTRFWEEYSHARVIDLSSRLKDFPYGIWSHSQGRRAWLESQLLRARTARLLDAECARW